MTETTFPVTGMHCASCAGVITRRISKLPGIKECHVNLATEEARVIYDGAKVDLAKMNSQIGKLGYSLHEPAGSTNHHDDTNLSKSDKMKLLEEQKREIYVVLPAAIVVFALMMWDLFGKFFPSIPTLPLSMDLQNTTLFVLASLILFKFGTQFITAVGRFFRYGSANMDTLVGLGTMTAYFYSAVMVLFPSFRTVLNLPEFLYFDVTIVVIGFIKYGKYLESRSKLKTGEAIEKLLHLGAKTALVIRNGRESEIPIEQVMVGDILLVKPGQKIPVDGIITQGASSIDESMITGESIPADKTVSDIVIGATLNKQSTFHMKATKVGEDTMLSQIVIMVKDAQGSKAPIERLADRISAVFVPVTLVFAVLVFATWVIVGSRYMSINQAASYGMVSLVGILVIACPCALGLATPTAIIVGVGKGAQNGILIKNAESLEKFNQVNYIIFDKTGTLTKGQPEVTDETIVGDLTQSEMYRVFGSLEKLSEHPLASAVVQKAKTIVKQLTQVQEFSIIEGKGVEGMIDGQMYYAGSPKLITEKKIRVDQSIIKTYATTGKTPIILANQKSIIAYLAIADTIKDEAKTIINKLHTAGIKVAMLTGDNQITANYIAKSLGIDTVIAEVLPGDKAREVKKMQAHRHVIAMVGDGINDAPALATADVGVAMGTGTDVAIESAGITLLSGNLERLYQTVILARKTMSIVKQNLFWAFFYNVVGIPIAAGILYPIWGIMLNPSIAGAAMAFSSVSVVTNSLRLKTAKI